MDPIAPNFWASMGPSDDSHSTIFPFTTFPSKHFASHNLQEKTRKHKKKKNSSQISNVKQVSAKGQKTMVSRTGSHLALVSLHVLKAADFP